MPRVLRALWHYFMIENDIKKFSVSCMSNSKWRKLFSGIHEGALDFDFSIWKLVNDNAPIKGFLPDIKQLGENHVGDCGALNGPFEFKLIEWLLIPKEHGYYQYEKAPIKYHKQDIEMVERKINETGNFEYDVTSEGIKIYGYKP
tara:strand:+ start:4846 stop:5280 length:435 start_codon:yes stop_codon:yes gene_type:complete